jgi:hypothetical protein
MNKRRNCNNRKIAWIIGVIFSLHMFHFCYSQNTFQISADAVHELQQFNFAGADSLISVLEKYDQDHYLTHFTKANYYWWQIITHPRDEVLEQRYQVSLENTIKSIDKTFSGKNSPEILFWLINTYAFKARLDLLNFEYIKAVRHLRKCIGFIEESLGEENNYPDLNLTSGLYNYMADYGSKKYPFLRLYTLLYPIGNMEKGLVQLNHATQSANRVISAEAHYFLMRIYFELEENYEIAAYHANWLVSHFPYNPIYLYYAYLVSELNPSSIILDRLRGRFFDAIENNKHLTRNQRDHLFEMMYKASK